MSEIRQKGLSGIGWTSAAQAIDQLLRFTIGIILARLLGPESFGLIAMVTVLTGFATLMSDLGFTSALIQRKEVGDPQLSSIFWINVVLGGLVYIGFFLLSSVVGSFYEQPVLRSVTQVLSLTIWINSLNSVQRAWLTRNMNFKAMALCGSVSVLAAGAVGIVMAVSGFGVWSLVGQRITASLIAVVLFWSASNWRPKFMFKVGAVRKLLRYSTNHTGSLLTNYWVRNTDNLLIGKFLTSVDLGIYARAYGLMLLPIRQISKVIGRVIFPILSRRQEDTEWVRNTYLRTISAIALAAFPLMVLLSLSSRQLVPVLFGDAWILMIPVLQVLALASVVQSVTTTLSWIFTSQGRTDLMFRWSAVSGSALILSIVIGLFFGTAFSVAVSYSIMSSAILPYFGISIAGRLIGMTFWDVVNSVRQTVSITLLMAACVVAVDLVASPHLVNALVLALKVGIGSVVYVTITIFVDTEPLRDVRHLIRAYRRDVSLHAKGLDPRQFSRAT